MNANELFDKFVELDATERILFNIKMNRFMKSEADKLYEKKVEFVNDLSRTIDDLGKPFFAAGYLEKQILNRDDKDKKEK